MPTPRGNRDAGCEWDLGVANQQQSRHHSVMNLQAALSSMKILSYIVLLAMVAALGYAAWIAFTHWSGIGV